MLDATDSSTRCTIMLYYILLSYYYYIIYYHTIILYIFIFFTFRLSFHKQLCCNSISEIFNVFLQLSCRDTKWLYRELKGPSKGVGVRIPISKGHATAWGKKEKKGKKEIKNAWSNHRHSPLESTSTALEPGKSTITGRQWWGRIKVAILPLPSRDPHGGQRSI